MIIFQIPPESSSIQRVTINNVIFYIQLDWSVREEAWYLTLLDVSRVVLMSGRKLQFGTSPTAKYSIQTLGGNLYIRKVKQSSNYLGRDNFGADKEYQLVWISTEEETSVGIV